MSLRLTQKTKSPLTAKSLQDDIDFRDKQVVHRGSGAHRGSSWNMLTPTAQILILPDKQSRDPGTIVKVVDDYIELVVSLFETNRANAHLRPR